MSNKKILDVVGTIILFMGFFLAFLPHALHNAVLKDNETSHLKHDIYGMILVVVGLGVLIYNNDGLKKIKKK